MITKNFKPVSHFRLSVFLGLCLALSACSSLRMSTDESRKLILRDEGLSQLSYVDVSNPEKNWYLPVPAGRDLQLVGNKKILIGTGNGFEERNISNGEKAAEITVFPGTQTARRLRNGNTLLAGADWQGKKGIVLVEIDNQGTIKRSVVYPGFNYVRCIRETIKGNFLVTADDVVFEGDDKGNIVWQAKVAGPPAKPHIWQALRLANGQTVVSTGYGKNFQVFSANGKAVTAFSGPAEVNPNFFAGFQILKNGNYVVTNWQGHGAKFGASGIQILEFSPKGKLVWSWKQDPAKFSSLQGVIVLNGLDLNKLHVENREGVLTPVNM
ncbi:MAG: hypothetical protein H7Y13_05040 [Sphingobacteriaceae bacterium]|nr:hypothetical protein [Sphingobacteriaceae bacterium]